MTDDRGVTMPINYLLVIGVMALLSTGLLMTTSSYVENQQDQTIRSELEVIGNTLAGELAKIDRLAQRTGTTGEIEMEVKIPSQVAGSHYQIQIVAGGSDMYFIELSSANPEISVTISLKSRTTISEGSIDGDDLIVTFDTATGKLEVTNA